MPRPIDCEPCIPFRPVIEQPTDAVEERIRVLNLQTDLNNARFQAFLENNLRC